MCLVAVHVNMLGVHWMCISYKGDGVKISHVATDCCTLACGVMWSHKKIPVLLYSGMWHCIILSLGSIITIFWDVTLFSSVSRFSHCHILVCDCTVLSVGTIITVFWMSHYSSVSRYCHYCILDVALYNSVRYGHYCILDVALYGAVTKYHHYCIMDSALYSSVSGYHHYCIMDLALYSSVSRYRHYCILDVTLYSSVSSYHHYCILDVALYSSVSRYCHYCILDVALCNFVNRYEPPLICF